MASTATFATASAAAASLPAARSSCGRAPTATSREERLRRRTSSRTWRRHAVQNGGRRGAARRADLVQGRRPDGARAASSSAMASANQAGSTGPPASSERTSASAARPTTRRPSFPRPRRLTVAKHFKYPDNWRKCSPSIVLWFCPGAGPRSAPGPRRRQGEVSARAPAPFRCAGGGPRGARGQGSDVCAAGLSQNVPNWPEGRSRRLKPSAEVCCFGWLVPYRDATRDALGALLKSRHWPRFATARSAAFKQ